MDYIHEFVDERQKSWCIHCGASISGVGTNKDHVPSKVLLRKPYPKDLPVVTTCTTCNNGFSADEEYLFLFLHCALVGSTDPGWHTDSKVVHALWRHEKLRSRIERSKTEYRTVGGKTGCVWKPEMERVERVVVKNARNHVFYEYGEPMLINPERVWTRPLTWMTATQSEEFNTVDRGGDLGLCFEVGSRMLTRILTGKDMCGGWVVVQDEVYRFLVEQCSGILVKSVLLEYLATEVFWSDY